MGTFHGFVAVLSRPRLLLLWQGTVLWLAIASWLIVVAATKTPRRWQLGLVALATAKLVLSLAARTTPAASQHQRFGPGKTGLRSKPHPFSRGHNNQPLGALA
ncbi:hypothetical protein IQ254_02205 [Nodosilinea sp. LEGE 07088]|uniref:hypothetical protein n=1 Tax=Nodosilinea sp. LEGE 07088 TaxID=2777968 RepID=UPI00187E8C38|nr:hypothetical protein [Nodosilinea sp. LEGE 07088]MBE9136026.1 hypothetical protein [Nodosilinea sp. LEGE 07088]